MGFSQMRYLLKLNIKNNINQNDQCSLVKWDILCLLHTSYLPLTILQLTYLPTKMYYLPTNPPTCLDVVRTFAPTHLPIYLLTHPPTYLFTY
jgi:hypothetical protein